MGGVPAHGGAFAVPKNQDKSRWIAPNETLNMLVDDSKLVKVEMPFLPQLRAMIVPKGARLLVSKRDARRYFHLLKSGSRWRKYLAFTPIRKTGLKLWPCWRSWPMGFR